MSPIVERFIVEARRKSLQFHVRPRYTPGSPALVHDEVAFKVAQEEARAYEHALSGVWGEDEKKRAETLGLEGIAYVMFEKGSGRQFRWHVMDLITGTETRRLHQNELHRLGYYRFEHLPHAAQERLVQPGCKYPDYDRAFFKGNGLGEWTPYKAEVIKSEEVFRG